jgi:hypothetical protein
MTASRNPLHVLIAGAGVAWLEAALALQALTEDEVSVELVAPEAEFTYRPLAVTEPFRVGEVKRFPLQKLTDAAGARLLTGSLAAVDPERKVVTLENGQELTYDTLLSPSARGRARPSPERSRFAARRTARRSPPSSRRRRRARSTESRSRSPRAPAGPCRSTNSRF